MWWYNLKIIAVAVLSVLLSSCGTMSVGQLNHTSADAISRIAVTETSGRAGQIYSRKLRRALFLQDTLQPDYNLTSVISVTSSSTLSVRGVTSTFKKMSMSAKFTLIGLSNNEVLMTDSVTADATLGTVSSLFGQDQSETHARDRMADLLAQRVVQRLQLYFMNLPQK